MSLLDLFFREMGLSETSLHINSIGCPVCRTEYNIKLKKYLEPKLSALCTTCQNRYEKNPLRIIDCKEPGCQPLVKNAPALLDNLCTECQDHFDSFCAHLDELELKYTVDNNIVRGLDYYTRTVFEFVSEHVGTQGTICGGGRYDGLVEEVGGQPTPGIGFALGVERLMLELQQQNAIMIEALKPVIYIAALGSAASYVRKISLKWRNKGLRVDSDLMGRSLKAQMKYASKQGIRFTAVIGDDEIENGRLRIKDMNKHSETEMSFEEAISFLLEKQKEG